MALAVGLADRNIAGQAKAKALAEERGEGEVVVAGITRRFGRQQLRRSTSDVCCHGVVVNGGHWTACQ
jgi:hypothetical protein